MELRQLRYFVTVAEELHFGRAAERMHIVQPAVSQQVRRLERELGVELFDRSPRHVRLTAVGERLLPEARAALAATDRITATAAAVARKESGGELRIGVGPGVSARLQSGLARLRETTAELSVRLSAGSLPDQLEAVRTGRLDLVVARGAGDWADVEVFRLWDEPVTVALPARHPLAAESAVRLDQLDGLALRVPSDQDDLGFADWLRTACSRAGGWPRFGRPVGRLADTLVEIGNGEDSWTAFSGCPSDTTAPRFVALRPVSPELRIPVWLVVSGTRPTLCAQALLAAFAGSGSADCPDSDGVDSETADAANTNGANTNDTNDAHTDGAHTANTNGAAAIGVGTAAAASGVPVGAAPPGAAGD